MQRRYKRYFIILETEDKESGVFKNEGPKGHGKIEVKNDEGTLSINCQNLKKASNTERYRWYLINTNKEEEPTIVEVGPMEVDDKGKGEVVWEFNAENVRGSMELIDDFNVLVLTVQNKEDKDNLFIPLVGYMGKEKSTSWRYALEKYLYIPIKTENKNKEKIVKEKKNIEESNAEKKQTPDEDLKLESQKETKEEPKKEEFKIKQEEALDNEDFQDEEKPDQKLMQEFKSEEKLRLNQDIKKEDINNKTINSEEYSENIWDEKDREYIPIKADSEETLELENSSEFSLQMQGYIENALKEFPKVEPFYNNLDDFTWWQIPYNHQTIYRSYMPFILYVDSLSLPANYYRSKMLQTVYLNRHHIFGILYDENKKAKCYAYGVLARNISSEQPYEGATGFNYWHPCDPQPHDLYSYGYWILKVDPKTGKVIKE